MNQEKPVEAGARPIGETCLCRDAARRLLRAVQLPEATRQHLHNSRVEFLRAVRSLIDARIDELLSARDKGTRLTVE